MIKYRELTTKAPLDKVQDEMVCLAINIPLLTRQMRSLLQALKALMLDLFLPVIDETTVMDITRTIAKIVLVSEGYDYFRA